MLARNEVQPVGKAGDMGGTMVEDIGGCALSNRSPGYARPLPASPLLISLCRGRWRLIGQKTPWYEERHRDERQAQYNGQEASPTSCSPSGRFGVRTGCLMAIRRSSWSHPLRSMSNQHHRSLPSLLLRHIGIIARIRQATTRMSSSVKEDGGRSPRRRNRRNLTGIARGKGCTPVGT